MAEVFVSYSHADDALWDRLQVHLAMLKRQGAIDVWHDRRITAGNEVDTKISASLERADVILLLVSPDFLASNYCYDIEMTRALERHDAGEARVIPVILRPCDWAAAPFRKLRATPKDGKPVTKWPNEDDAFLDVVKDIRAALKEMEDTSKAAPVKTAEAASPKRAAAAAADHLSFGEQPRSANLRVRKKFTDADKDRFLKEAFDYIANFFESSLKELTTRNADIEATFERHGRTFIADVYRNGKKHSSCKVKLGGALGGITYAVDSSAPDSTCNAAIDVEVTEQALMLKATFSFSSGDGLFGMQGAAEHYWAMLMEPLQR